MLPKLDQKVGLVCFKRAIEISNRYLWIIVHAFAAVVLVNWSSRRAFAFDEDITRAGVNVQSIWNPCNG